MQMLGNLASLIGSLLMVSIGFVREKRRILLAQCGQFAFMAAGNLLLGAIAGVVSNVVSICRNLTFTAVRPTGTLKTAFIALQLVLTLQGGAASPVELCPLLSAVLFTWSLDTESAVRFKAALIAAQALWLIYDACYHNIAAVVFDALTILSNVCGILAIQRR